MCYRFIPREFPSVIQQQSTAGKDSVESSADQREMAKPADTSPAREQVATAYERFMADMNRRSERQEEQITKP